MIRAVLYLLTVASVSLTALAGIAALLAAGVPLDTATTIASTAAAGLLGGLFVWDVLYNWNRGDVQ